MFNRVAVAVISSLRIVGLGVVSLGVLAAPTVARAQAGPPDLLYRIERLENQIRQLTGEIEQLQYRNQQLEAALNEGRYQDPGGRGAARTATAPSAAAPPMPPPAAAPPMPTPAAPGMSGGGRRSDAFDPAENPHAPGAPRALGSVQPQPPPPMSRPGMESTPYATGGAGGADPGYRSAGTDPGYGRPPAGAAPYGAGSPPSQAVATASPPPPGAGSPREIYDTGTAYLQRRDYEAAEEAFRDFLRRYPSDRLAADAQFSLGESLFQRQSYQDAADAFVQLSKKYETSAKAPDALLRLGQSLAALNEKELACVAFADVGRKYPRAQPNVKQAIEREQKRARC
jgi:tol-pal system protein YbgF